MNARQAARKARPGTEDSSAGPRSAHVDLLGKRAFISSLARASTARSQRAIAVSRSGIPGKPEKRRYPTVSSGSSSHLAQAAWKTGKAIARTNKKATSHPGVTRRDSLNL